MKKAGPIITKRKLFFSLSALTFILIFSVAVVCSWCSNQPEDIQKIDVDRSEQTTTTNVLQETEQTEDETQSGEISPTISLEIETGPTFAEEGRVCFYRVKAIVYGSPVPEIRWSKDDSNGAWGRDIAQVNLSEGEVYVLTAEAVNTAGTAEDSITLQWQDESP